MWNEKNGSPPSGLSWTPTSTTSVEHSLRVSNYIAPPPDPFPAGTLVETHSLKATQMNGLKGVVIGPQGDRLRIQLEEPHGEKALKPANLKVIDKQDGEEEGTST